MSLSNDERHTILEDDGTTDIQNGTGVLEAKGPKPAYSTASIKTWPVGILFIIANEFCERYEILRLFEGSIFKRDQ